MRCSDAHASAALRSAGIAAPASVWASVVTAGVRVSRLPAAARVAERFLLTLAAGAALPAPLAALPVVSSDAWWWSEVAAAVPTVFAATQEKFVPQMINFEVLGGVNFKKGCYPGQEIVARSQYLGKLKRRMQLAHAELEDPPPAGADVFASAQKQPIGTVVMAARAPGGGVDLLFEAPVDRVESGVLHVGAVDGPRLRIDASALRTVRSDRMSTGPENWYVYYPAPRERGAEALQSLRVMQQRLLTGNVSRVRIEERVGAPATPTWMEVYEGIDRSRRLCLGARRGASGQPAARRVDRCAPHRTVSRPVMPCA